MGRSLSEFIYYEGMEKKKLSGKYVLPVLAGFLLINVVVVDVILFGSKTSTSSPSAASTSFCSENCISDIMSRVSSYIKTTSSTSSNSGTVDLAGISSATLTLTPIPTDTPTPTDTPIPTNTPTPIPTVKEFFIPLGQGSGSYVDWTVVPGIGAKIDPSNYGQIDKVYFEATIRVPNANQTVDVRLYNSNTYQSIAGSNLSFPNGTITTLLVSQPINLQSGNNLYQVQIKTQLQSMTYIDQARIRIQTK